MVAVFRGGCNLVCDTLVLETQDKHISNRKNLTFALLSCFNNSAFQQLPHMLRRIGLGFFQNYDTRDNFLTVHIERKDLYSVTILDVLAVFFLSVRDFYSYVSDCRVILMLK